MDRATDGWPAAAPARDGIPARVGVVVDRVPPSLVSAAISATKLSPNGDGKLDISDAVWVLAHLFMGGPEPASIAAADTNGDGTVDISDPIYLLGYLFLGGPAPVCPAGA